MTCHVTCQNAGGYPRILYAVVCYYFSIIIKVSGATARWPFTDSAVPSLLLLLLFLFLFFFLFF